MKNVETAFAEQLLEVKAIKLQPENPFTWASGWKSPFYCDKASFNSLGSRVCKTGRLDRIGRFNGDD